MLAWLVVMYGELGWLRRTMQGFRVRLRTRDRSRLLAANDALIGRGIAPVALIDNIGIDLKQRS